MTNQNTRDNRDRRDRDRRTSAFAGGDPSPGLAATMAAAVADTSPTSSCDQGSTAGTSTDYGSSGTDCGSFG